jgi:hypothetical protein
MSGNKRYVLGAAIACVTVVAAYAMSSNSTAYSYRDPSSTPRIDVLAIMSASSNLPSEQFDAT